MDPTNISILLNNTSLIITGTSLFINGTLINENTYEHASACTVYNPRRSDTSLTVFIVFIFLAGSFLGYGFGAVERVELLWTRRAEGNWLGEKCKVMMGAEEQREREGWGGDGEHETGVMLLERREKRVEMVLGGGCERDGFVEGGDVERGWGCGVSLAAEDNVDGVMDGPWRDPNLFLCS
ncbi:uncharacterized protein EAE97_000957 [Botrytis byssoidea]|uniref:Uncharacterized protein n=1 Tax=Botrytis byssoidea TaxID=139641 RepID=A0A9P5M3H5_9HELO|nr:uncharacterized protein EAE97_000957 [Botrytis byssoidea]KAF7953558.1 hypothetical protein EAE97_000957 [Botrytis byssoidea]